MENSATRDEKMLLSRIASGDERAFKQLFEQWHPLLATHIYRVTQSRPLTEEIVQDVFLKIWNNREALDDIQHFWSYLLVISRNHALNALQRKAREYKHSEQILAAAGMLPAKLCMQAPTKNGSFLREKRISSQI